MSSAYHLLCLSHDPAIVIDCDFRLDEIEAVTREHEALAAHQGCDIMAGRFSYPLIEAACFGRMQMTGTSGCEAAGHRGVIWTDKDWLLLLDAATAPPNTVSDGVLGGQRLRCWPPDRLRRLRRELGTEVPA